MKFKMHRDYPKNGLSVFQQLFMNRGLENDDIEKYTNLTDEDISPPEALGEEKLRKAAEILTNTIKEEKNLLILVDSDCDGYTSSAIFINWLYKAFPHYTTNHVKWFLHDEKVHGLTEEVMNYIRNEDLSLVWIPDAGSNDLTQIEELHNLGISVVLTDHHLLNSEPSPYAITINSQIDGYPNKELTGAGVTWQACRYLDKILNKSFAEELVDLVATGQIADMSDLHAFEVRRLIFKGLEPDNIKNPYLFELWQKNKFKLGDTPTDWGWTFYVCPLINAMTRSGTLDEKILTFEAMLLHKAFERIPSTKRGHKPGEMERRVDQAIRLATNVKNRQTKSETAGLTLLEDRIQENNMLDHKVLLFTVKQGEVDPGIRGLVANKLMAKYQRCCAVLTIDPEGENYSGSMRGCGFTGITDFKKICEDTELINWCFGHENAAGLSIPVKNIEGFIEKTDELLANTPDEAVYSVDFIWNTDDVNGEAILSIADFDKYIGQGFVEPLVAVSNIKINNNIVMMKSNTVKITTENGIDIIAFRMPDEEFEKLASLSSDECLNIVAKCDKNTWNGVTRPQLHLKDYEIIKTAPQTNGIKSQWADLF